MKHIFILICALCLSFQMKGMETLPLTADINVDYKKSSEWKRYKAFRAAGWASLGVGVAAIGTGVFVGLAEGSINGKSKAGPIIIYSGAGLSLGSIHLFIAANHNKKKAKANTLSLSVQPITHPTPISIDKATPALTFALTF